MNDMARGVGSEAIVIYEDNDIRVFSHIFGGNYIVIAFSNMLFKGDARSYWGKAFFEKNGISAIGIVAKGPNWFPARSIHKVAELIKAITGKFEFVATYGNSMGGYAALKYMNLLKADVSIAFSPQWSIDPRDAGDFERRFTRFYQPPIHGEAMAVAPGDHADRSYVFFDPFELADKEHVRRLAAGRGGIRTFAVPMTGPNSISIFAGSRSGNLLMEACRRDDAGALLAFISSARRRNPARARYAAEAAAVRHPKWAADIMSRAGQGMDGNDRVRACLNIALVHRAKGRIEEMKSAAAEAAVAAQSISAEDLARLRLYDHLHATAGLLMFGGQNEEAEQVQRLAVAGHSANVNFLRRLLRIEIELGRESEPRELIRYMLSRDEAVIETLRQDLNNRKSQSLREELDGILTSLRDGHAEAIGPWLRDLMASGASGASLTETVRQGVALLREGQREAGEAMLLSAMKAHPEDARLRRVLMDFYVEQNRHRDVVEHFGSMDPELFDGRDRLLIAKSCLKIGQDDRARAVLEAAARSHADNGEIFALLCSTLVRLKCFEEAVAAGEKALTLDPKKVDTQRDCARSLKAIGRPAAALPYFEQVLRLSPNMARSYLELGRILIDVGRNEEARDFFRKGLSIAPNDAEILLELGRTEARLGDRIVAMQMFERVLKLEPSSLKAGLEMVRQAMTMRKFDVAKPAAEALLDHYPNHPDVLFEFARMSLETAAPERAREAFTKALTIRPDFHQCHYRMAQLALRARDLKEATEHYSAAIAIQPDRVNYRIDRARAYLALNEMEAAKADAQHALGFEPANPKAIQIVKLVQSFTGDQPEPVIAAAFAAPLAGGVSDVQSLIEAIRAVPAPHRAFISREGAPEGEGVLAASADNALAALLEATTEPWMLVAATPEETASALAALADASTLAALLKTIPALYGRVEMVDEADAPRFVLYRRELVQLMREAAFIEKRPLGAMIQSCTHRLRTVQVKPSGKLFRLPAPTPLEEAGAKGVFLISRHGIELFGGGEQFLRGMAKVYRQLGYAPVIVGMRNDVPDFIYGEKDGERFANIRPVQGDIFALTLRHAPHVVQVLSGLGYEVITPLKFLHVHTVYGTHYWRDMFEEIGAYLDIDRHAVPKHEFAEIIQSASVVYSNSHFTADMKRKHFGFSTPIIYSLTDDAASAPSPTGDYALLVNARPEKGFDLILEVAKRAPKVRFLVIASQSPVAQAEEAIAQAGVTNIQVIGRTNDMEAIYRGSRVVLVPSYSFIETFSRVVIEAHRLGLPTVGSDRGNVPFLLEQSGVALPEDPDAWAEELTRLFTDDAYHAERRKMAMENSERYAFARQPERIRRIVDYCGRRVLVGVGAGLGNIVQTTPLLRRMAEYYGHPIDVVVKEDFKGCSFLAAGQPWVNMVFPLDRNVLQREYDLVYVTHSFGDLIPSFNANETIAARRYYPFEMTRDIHESEFNLFCADKLLEIPYEKRDATKYFVASAEKSKITNGIIALHSGGKGGEWEGGWLNKRWPYYRELVSELQSMGFQVASFGVGDEYVPGTIDMTGTPLMQTIHNLGKCSYFIGNDSGVMHIADGLGVPLTTIFGPTSVVKNGPLASTSSVLELKKPCAPCQFDERFSTCTCISEIPTKEYLAHILDHMDKCGVLDDLRKKMGVSAGKGLLNG